MKLVNTCPILALCVEDSKTSLVSPILIVKVYSIFRDLIDHKNKKTKKTETDSELPEMFAKCSVFDGRTCR